MPDAKLAGSLAALAARHPDVELRVTQHEAGLMLDLIRVERGRRGRGLATLAFADLLALADEHDLVVALTPAPSASDSRDPAALGYDQLEAWYARHGFEVNGGSRRDVRLPGSMIRRPRPPFANRRTPPDAAEQVARLSRRTAHAAFALLEASRELNMPVKASEVIIYDVEALSTQSTGRALSAARRSRLADNWGGVWTPTLHAHDLRGALEDRFLADTAQDGDE